MEYVVKFEGKSFGGFIKSFGYEVVNAQSIEEAIEKFYDLPNIKIQRVNIKYVKTLAEKFGIAQ